MYENRRESLDSVEGIITSLKEEGYTFVTISELLNGSSAKPNTNSIVVWMNANGMNSSYNNRAKLATQYGIKGYKDTAAQKYTTS